MTKNIPLLDDDVLRNFYKNSDSGTPASLINLLIPNIGSVNRGAYLFPKISQFSTRNRTLENLTERVQK